MAIREFADAQGRHWRVWDTYPGKSGVPPVAPLAVELAGGWLTFAAGRERKRLVPIPPNWEEAPEEQLARWLTEAAPRPRQPPL